MSPFFRLYCRIYQFCFRIASGFLPFREPILLEGPNCLSLLPKLIYHQGITNVMVVTDYGLTKAGLVSPLLSDLKTQGIKYVIYDKTVANPTINNIEEAVQLYLDGHCQGLIAVGGGSPMDMAKGTAARIGNPHKLIPQMKGLFKVSHKIPPLFVVPTTAGTGSETTLAAVITNSQTHEKYAINDPHLIPHYAVLDPVLTVGLPKQITSTTGIDALTHAVEAYIGRSNTKHTEKMAVDAVKLIFENLYKAYNVGTNLIARANMQKAAYKAGVAFTRAYVGNVHAIAHTLGGFYQVPHGLANAVILPYILDFYGKTATKRLARLADLSKQSDLKDSDEQKASKFIASIRNLNASMEIPEQLKGIIKEVDIPLMAKRAFSEANPLYPVPKIMDINDFITIYHLIM
ncbi:MAG: iron-containing alcohol dehydrogenase [Candidatus Izemoplasmatales bacterium]|nr:iron-containing alcohol dehydrogenase [Candidatus Izemoplasmatales bacterium]